MMPTIVYYLQFKLRLQVFFLHLCISMYLYSMIECHSFRLYRKVTNSLVVFFFMN